MPSPGFGEIVLVIIAVIIFVKPKDLPKFFKNSGNFYAEIQRGYSRIKHMTENTLHDISRTENSGGNEEPKVIAAKEDTITVPKRSEPAEDSEK